MRALISPTIRSSDATSGLSIAKVLSPPRSRSEVSPAFWRADSELAWRCEISVRPCASICMASRRVARASMATRLPLRADAAM
eukprot:scaffold171998_cov30-Tisochrysis_lutea.AAC.1